MLTTSFTYFISFLIFAFFAYRYGHKKMRAALDEKISAIASSLSKASEEKEEAQLILSAIKQELRELDDVLNEKMKDAKDRIDILHNQQKENLLALLADRENHHNAFLQSEKQMRTNQLKLELTQAVLNEIRTAFAQDKKLQNAFEKKSMELLSNLNIDHLKAL